MRRRYEILLPLDEHGLNRPLIEDAVEEIIGRTGGLSYSVLPVQGCWIQQNILYRDKLVKVTTDVEDTCSNRAWFVRFKARWEKALEQQELYITSHQIDCLQSSTGPIDTDARG